MFEETYSPTNAAGQYRAYLLGEFALKKNNQKLPMPQSEKSRSLLAYLLLYRDISHSRYKLAGIFWPLVAEKEALRRLSKALCQINTVLPGVLWKDCKMVQLDPQTPILSDVQEFQLLVESYFSTPERDPLTREKLRQACALYQGDLLPGIYDDWVMEKQEALRIHYERALEELLKMEKAAANYDNALDLALKLVNIDPLYEEANQEVMRLYLVLNRPNAALKHFEKYKEVLEKELMIESDPEPEVLQLVKEATLKAEKNLATVPLPFISDRPSVKIKKEPLTQDLPLIGREQIRAQILQHIEERLGYAERYGLRDTALEQDAAKKQSYVVFIEGEAGVGKTHLLQTIAKDAQWYGYEVVVCRGRREEVEKTYGLLVDTVVNTFTEIKVKLLAKMVSPIWLQVLSTIIPQIKDHLPFVKDPPPARPKQARERLAEAFIQICLAWTKASPVVLIIDDLHHIDRDSLDLLPKLFHRLRYARIIIISSFRTMEARKRQELWSMIQTMDKRIVRERIKLNSLSKKLSHELIRESLGHNQVDPKVLNSLYFKSDGNPLFILSSIRESYAQKNLVLNSKDKWRLKTEKHVVFPQTIGELIISTIGKLTMEEQEILKTASVLGSSVDVELLAEISTMDMRKLASMLFCFCRWDLLKETENCFEFNHDIFRLVAYGLMDESQQIRIHRKAALLLENRDVKNKEQLYYHFYHGEIWTKAVLYGLEVAEEAKECYANQKAIDIYRRCLRILEKKDPFPLVKTNEIQFKIYLSLQELYRIIGDGKKRKNVIEKLREIVLSMEKPWFKGKVLLIEAEYYEEIEADLSFARRKAEMALRIGKEHGLPQVVAEALLLLGNLYRVEDKLFNAIEITNYALRKVNIFEQDRKLFLYLNFNLAYCYFLMGRVEELKNLCRVLQKEVALINDPVVSGLYYSLLIKASKIEGDFLDTKSYLQKEYEYFHTSGVREYEADVMLDMGDINFYQYKYNQALDNFQAALDIYKSIQCKRGIESAFLHVGWIYRELEQWKKAEKFLRNGFNIAHELKAREQEVHFLCELLLVFIAKSNKPKVCFLIYLIKKLSKLINSQLLLYWVYLSLGHGQRFLGKTDQAVHYYTKLTYLTAEFGLRNSRALANSYLSVCYLQQKKFDQALAVSQAAIQEIENLEWGYEIHTIYFHHYQVLKAVKKNGKAYKILKKAYRVIQELGDFSDNSLSKKISSGQKSTVGEIREMYQKEYEVLKAGQINIKLPLSPVFQWEEPAKDKSVTVTWTVDGYLDKGIASKKGRRHHRILRLISEARAQHAVPTIGDLSQVLGVSKRTIDRDLAELRKNGQLVFPHGRNDEVFPF